MPMMRVNRLKPGILSLSLLLALAALVGRPTLAQGPAPAAPVRTDIAGDWMAFDLSAGFANLVMVNNEDQPHRVPGPELGDYTGLPINAAGGQKADAWDATILSQPERQPQAHPAQYWMRGPGPNVRILKI